MDAHKPYDNMLPNKINHSGAWHRNRSNLCSRSYKIKWKPKRKEERRKFTKKRRNECWWSWQFQLGNQAIFFTSYNGTRTQPQPILVVYTVFCNKFHVERASHFKPITVHAMLANGKRFCMAAREIPLLQCFVCCHLCLFKAKRLENWGEWGDYTYFLGLDEWDASDMASKVCCFVDIRNALLSRNRISGPYSVFLWICCSQCCVALRYFFLTKWLLNPRCVKAWLKTIFLRFEKYWSCGVSTSRFQTHDILEEVAYPL